MVPGSLGLVFLLYAGPVCLPALAQHDTLRVAAVLPDTLPPAAYPLRYPSADDDAEAQVTTVARNSLPDRWRYLDPNGLPVVGYSLLDPYHQNPLKGDFAVFGQHTFVVVTILGVPAATFSSQDNVDPQFNNKLIGALELFNGLTVFKPKTFSLKGSFQGVYNRGNADLEELELLEGFGELKLFDVGSERYDFTSTRVGIQAFTSDFNGFVFKDINLGGQLFGEAASNRYRWALAAFSQRQKSPGGGLTFDAADQTVLVGNLVVEDLFSPGFNGLFSVQANLDRSVAGNDLSVVYLGFASDGHLGRLEFNPALYAAFGKEDFNPAAGQEVSISAFLAGVELAYPQNWRTYRAAAFVASGDSDPDDDKAGGFDAILDNVGLFGGANSFVVGGGQFLTRPNSFLPAGRALVQGSGTRANFVNPGIQLLNLGLDAVLTPRLFLQLDANYFRFFDTAVLGQDVANALGYEVNGALRWRVFLNENFVLQLGGGAFFPQDGALVDGLPNKDTILTGNVALVALY